MRTPSALFFFFNDTATTEIYTLSLHDALPIWLMEGKTVVAIAHRLSTIAAMDRLIVLDRGRIVEEGDHRTLLAGGGLYARLWAHQSGGFLGEDAEDDALDAQQPGPEVVLH